MAQAEAQVVQHEQARAPKLPSGVPGLDTVLHGGFIADRAYLVRGGPGSGKTILGTTYLIEGARRGEKSLFITLGESADEIRRNAAGLGLDLSGVEILDLSPTAEFFTEVQSYDIFSPAEVERQPTTEQIIEAVEQSRPQRVFADAMTQFRYLATDPFQFRKQVLSFIRYLTQHGSTVLYASESSDSAPDDDLQFIADGVINLQSTADSRTLRVSKYRGSGYEGGGHAVRITDRGMEVFPRLVPAEHRREFAAETIPSGVPELDEMLHGGLERGTITIISGPSGAGKTTVGLQFMKEAAGRGERSVVYSFDEGNDTLLARAEGVGIPARAMVGRGTLAVNQIEPLRYTPEEFAVQVRGEVEERNARIVMLDSTSGYRLSLRGEDLVTHLHALSRYLKNMGATIILVSEVEYITGEFRATEVGVSYLADNIIFLRYMEVHGEITKVIGVLKKRMSSFEKTLRELDITGYGVKVGQPLTNLRGILRGTPELAQIREA